MTVLAPIGFILLVAYGVLAVIMGEWEWPKWAARLAWIAAGLWSIGFIVILLREIATMSEPIVLYPERSAPQTGWNHAPQFVFDAPFALAFMLLCTATAVAIWERAQRQMRVRSFAAASR